MPSAGFLDYGDSGWPWTLPSRSPRAWSYREHPDKRAEQLQQVLALAAEWWFVRERAERIRERDTDYPERVGKELDLENGDLVIFFDYGSMFQKPGTDGEAAAASYDSSAKAWSAASGACRLALRARSSWQSHGGALRSATFSPDGRQVFTASYRGTAKEGWSAAG